MAISKTSKVYTQIQQAASPLVTGPVICIDPSIGSNSSQPGWAFYWQGNLEKSGTFHIDPKLPIPERLQQLSAHCWNLYQLYSPRVLVYEEIPAQRQGGGNAAAHASLLKALGVILAVPGPAHYVGIMPISWKRAARESYIKSDENDAIEMGWVVISQAHKFV